MAAHQAPPSLGFSRQEHWSGLPFPSPMHENESEVAQSCPILSDPMDCSPPGSSIHGILQARVLEWHAIVIILTSLQKLNWFLCFTDKETESHETVADERKSTSSIFPFLYNIFSLTHWNYFLENAFYFINTNIRYMKMIVFFPLRTI